MARWRHIWRHVWFGRCWLAALLPLVLATAMGTSLGLLSRISPAGVWHPPAACACGLGNTPTMLADGRPALLYPVTTNVPADQPIGIFALQYVSGQPIKFTEDTSRVQGAPPLNTLKLRWTFGDGQASTTDVSPSHVFARAGAFAVHLQIYDPSIPTWTDLDSAEIQVVAAAQPNPPIARATASATAVVQTGTINFDASGSQALVGSHLSYLWNFNDATTATGPRATHAFNIAGKGFVALLVTDDRGVRSVATINIAVVSDPQQLPTASLNASPTSVKIGQRVDFDASGSQPAAQPSGDHFTEYDWDFGDGSPPQTTQEAAVSHSFQKAGTYTVAVQAVDQPGTPAQATIAITVGALSAQPVIHASPGTSPSWLLWTGLLVVLLIAGGGAFLLVRSQRRQAALEHQAQAAMELRRARRIPQAGTRPGDPRWGDPRAGGRTTTRNSAARQPAPQRNPYHGPPPANRP